MRNQLKVCHNNDKFVAKIIQGECRAAVSRQSNNNSEDIQCFNIVATNINYVATNTSKANLEDNSSHCCNKFHNRI